MLKAVRQKKYRVYPKIRILYAFPYLFENLNNSFLPPVEPTSMAQLDARPIGDQESAGLTPAGSATFFRGDWSWNIFYGHSLPSADSRRAVDSFWRKNVHNTG